MPRTKLTLHIEEDLIKKMKHQAVEENRTVSDITEQLYQEYLKRGKAKK